MPAPQRFASPDPRAHTAQLDARQQQGGHPAGTRTNQVSTALIWALWKRLRLDGLPLAMVRRALTEILPEPYRNLTIRARGPDYIAIE
jgi:hypothetical protein